MKLPVEWRPTVGQARDAILDGRIIGTGDADMPFPADIINGAMEYATWRRRSMAIVNAASDAVAAGRMIDFGHIPNTVLQDGGRRGGPLYTKGVLGQPFREPWVLYHTWEHAVSLYLVVLVQPDRPTGGDCDIVELCPTKFGEDDGVMMLGDIISLEPDPESELSDKQYSCRARPSMWRYMPGAEMINNGGTPEAAAAGNVLDPLMTALLMLSTTGIERKTISPSDKLNRARIKSRKPLIPPYDVVVSGPYVTAITLRASGHRGESKGGTHAPPVPHLRRGHVRRLASGEQTFVRDALVNMTTDARDAFAQRSHYTIRK